MTTDMVLTLDRHPDALLRVVIELRRRGVAIESLNMKPIAENRVQVLAALHLGGRDKDLVLQQVSRSCRSSTADGRSEATEPRPGHSVERWV